MNFAFASIFTNEGPRIGKPKCFTLGPDCEVIRKEVSHKLDRPLVNPSKKVWRDSKRIKTPTLPFHIGDSLKYTNEGHNEMEDLVYLNTNNPYRLKYRIKFLRGNTMVVTKELLKSRNAPEIGSIPISL